MIKNLEIKDHVPFLFWVLNGILKVNIIQIFGKTLSEKARSVKIKRITFTLIEQNLGEYQKSQTILYKNNCS